MKIKIIKFIMKGMEFSEKMEEELSKVSFPENIEVTDIQEIDLSKTLSLQEQKLVVKYAIKIIPTVIFVDMEGRVKARFFKSINRNIIEEYLAEMSECGGRYVIIEDFNGCISLVTDPDSGDTLVFETYDEAAEEAKKCQKGKVVKL